MKRNAPQPPNPNNLAADVARDFAEVAAAQGNREAAATLELKASCLEVEAGLDG